MSPEYSARKIVAAIERRETDLLLAPFIPRLLASFYYFQISNFSLKDKRINFS